jgi:hypothetical protein
MTIWRKADGARVRQAMNVGLLLGSTACGAQTSSNAASGATSPSAWADASTAPIGSAGASGSEGGSSSDDAGTEEISREAGLDAATPAPDADAVRGDEAGDDAAPASFDAGLWSSPVTSGPPVVSGPSVAATVTVNQETTTGRLTQGFVGLSYEKSHMTDQFFESTNAPLVAMCKLLGPSVVRIGGNSVDRTLWQPTAPPAAVSALSSSIGTADVDGLATFLEATGWSVIYGLNLKTSTPQLAAAEATYATSRLTGHIAAFEIGNEPDLYGQPYATWSANWASWATAVLAAEPGASLAGPATAGGGVYDATQLAHAEAGRLTLLTQHYYRGGASGETMSGLVSPDPGLVTGTLEPLSTAVTSNHIPDGFRLAEANSYFGHGAPGISDALGSALWAIDFLFANAQNGSGGVNFHGGGAGQDGSKPFIYTPINEMNGIVTDAQPIFYGMLLVTSAGTGTVLATAVQVSQVNFTGYAVSRPDGSTNVVLVNKDTAQTVDASVDAGKAVTEAEAIFLEGPSILATSGVTLAGAGISSAGEWNPKPAWTLPVSGHVVTVAVSPASAVLIHVE